MRANPEMSRESRGWMQMFRTLNHCPCPDLSTFHLSPLAFKNVGSPFSSLPVVAISGVDLIGSSGNQGRNRAGIPPPNQQAYSSLTVVPLEYERLLNPAMIYQRISPNWP